LEVAGHIVSLALLRELGVTCIAGVAMTPTTDSDRGPGKHPCADQALHGVHRLSLSRLSLRATARARSSASAVGARRT